MRRARPTERPFLTATWLDLLMLNWTVEPGLLRSLVPGGTELDSWRGATYLSLVGFRFRDTRVLGIPVPWHRHFEEVNLRFYVRRDSGSGTRRGVVFVAELVPRPAIAWVARALYNEPYRSLPMRHAIDGQPSSRALRYEWRRRGSWERISARTTGTPSPLTPGSEEEFITEHYWAYTRQRDGSTAEYEVAHPPWRVCVAREARVDADLAALYGRDLGAALAHPPRSAFLAEGSSIIVYRPQRLPTIGSQLAAPSPVL